VLDTALLVSVVNEEAKAPLVPLGILAEGQGLTNHMGAVRAIARCESRARVRGAMRARLCSRAPSFVARVPYRWPPVQWHVGGAARVWPLLRQSVAPQRRQVTAIRGVPSCSEPMTATDHEPSVKTRPLPPVAEVGLLKVRNARTRFMTDEEENQLMSTCWPRLRPIFIAALHTGLRREELATLT
jgi:hypothetical protein